jgi:hypothetical protein
MVSVICEIENHGSERHPAEPNQAVVSVAGRLRAPHCGKQSPLSADHAAGFGAPTARSALVRGTSVIIRSAEDGSLISSQGGFTGASQIVRFDARTGALYTPPAAAASNGGYPAAARTTTRGPATRIVRGACRDRRCRRQSSAPPKATGAGWPPRRPIPRRATPPPCATLLTGSSSDEGTRAGLDHCGRWAEALRAIQRGSLGAGRAWPAALRPGPRTPFAGESAPSRP